jgi:hypothetical protein
MDMSMTKVSEENQIHMDKGCIKRHAFSICQKDFHSHFSEDKKTMSGFIMKLTKIWGTQNSWLGMRRIAVKNTLIFVPMQLKLFK